MIVSLDTNSLIILHPIIPFPWVSDSSFSPGQVPPCPLWSQWDKTLLSHGCTVSWEGKVVLGISGRLC